jgi:hypothetical protein
MLKKTMCLPWRTTRTFFHVSTDHGGLGLCSVEDVLDTTACSHQILPMLTYPDKRVNDIAWYQ